MHTLLRTLAALAIVATAIARPPAPDAKPAGSANVSPAAPTWAQTSANRGIPPDFRSNPNLIVAPLRGQLTRSLPGQVVRPLPGQITGALRGQMIRPLPGQIVGPLFGQIVRSLPGQIVP